MFRPGLLPDFFVNKKMTERIRHGNYSGYVVSVATDLSAYIFVIISES